MRNILLVVTYMSILLVNSGVQAQTINVINMIPATLSSETNQDSEPDITVNPNDPDVIVASAFTPNPTGATATAPVFISSNGGSTWVLNNIVPSGNGMTGDITVALSRNNVLYAGILRGGAGLSMRILRSATYTGAGAMTQLLSRGSDQPYARVYSPMGGPQVNNDHLYVGHNETAAAGTPSATFEQSLNAATAAAPAGLTTTLLEQRTPSGQDGPPVRQAIHPDGTVYGLYIQRTASAGSVRTGNVVVVRDNNWGNSATTYSALTDPSDTVAGRFVVTGVSWVWNTGSAFGQERLGDRGAIAVDPTDSQTVYVSWADRPAGVTGNTSTIHVRRSTDGGQTWSADIRTIAGALNPNLAVNIRGDVGFLYQQLVGAGATQTWQTHYQQSTDGGVTWTDYILSNTPSNTPVRAFGPYLGDYTGLTAVGKDFFGVFSANNTPNNANFPQGVTYQRNANFTTNTLLNSAGTSSVAVSIDPFFFRVRNQDEGDDFYVRDWTDSTTVNDTGVEPSTDPWFFSTSDVWNRRSNASGGFDANDRPISQDPQEAASGSNFAFARVHRKNVGAAQTVSLHFLKSELGTGSNYQNAAATADPTLMFSATDQVQTMSSGYQWDLVTTGSSHTCLAVEISTPGDPFVLPGLTGRAPGWPNPDLMVIYDNNKAQRNMGVYAGGGDGSSIRYYGIIHNAATRIRDMVLTFKWSGTGDPVKIKPGVIGNPGTYRIAKDHIVLKGMDPGENRWVSLTVPMNEQMEKGQHASMTFTETLGGLALNGFTIDSVRASIPRAGREDLAFFASNLSRIGYLFDDKTALKDSRLIAKLAKSERFDESQYTNALIKYFKRYQERVGRIQEKMSDDPFDLKTAMKRVIDLLKDKNPKTLLPAMSSLNHSVDAYLTYIMKKRGDVADVGQNMRILLSLLRKDKRVAKYGFVKELVAMATKFEWLYSKRKATPDDFARTVHESLPIMIKLDKLLSLNQKSAIKAMKSSKGNPQAMQRAHHEFLSGWLHHMQ